MLRYGLRCESLRNSKYESLQTWFSWASMERSLSINTPRLLALLEKVMALLPMITRSTSIVYIFVDDKQGIIPVFASLSFNLFWVIHALIDTKHSVVSFKTERIWLAWLTCTIVCHQRTYGKAWNAV